MEQEAYHQEIHLTDYIKIIRQRKWAIITFFVITVCVVTIGSFLQTPVYRATVTMLIDVETPDMLSIKDNIALGAPGYMAYKEYYQTQVEIIQGRSIANEVYDFFSLGGREEYAKAKDPIKVFLKKLKVEPVRDTRLLRIHFEDKDRQLATDIANKIAAIYAEKNLAYISTSENLNLLKNEYLKLQSKFSEYSKQFKDKHPKMIQLKQELAEMEGRINREKGPLTLNSLKANNVRIMDAAEVPKKPIRPNKRLNIFLSVVVGLVGGTGLAFFFEYLDNTLKTAEDVEKFTQFPFLGSVPTIEGKYSELEKDKFVHLYTKTPISESYRAIRTSLMFSRSEANRIKNIIITSPSPREGKTTTLCNLGITMAHAGNSVLLVDSDMRKPRLHIVFNQKNDTGLSNFLTGQAAFDDIIKKTDIENLHVVTCGLHPPNPSELLGTKRMSEFLEKAGAKFDKILFDSPPITVVTDASVLAGMMDGTILVVESGKTSRTVTPRVKQLLKDAKAKILGVVLNSAHVERNKYYYYYGHDRA